jgi:hypothetical protein
MSNLTTQEQLNNTIQKYNESVANLLKSKVEYTKNLEVAYEDLKGVYTTHLSILKSVNDKQRMDITGLKNTIETLQTALRDATVSTPVSTPVPEPDVIEVPDRVDNVA